MKGTNSQRQKNGEWRAGCDLSWTSWWTALLVVTLQLRSLFSFRNLKLNHQFGNDLHCGCKCCKELKSMGVTSFAPDLADTVDYQLAAAYAGHNCAENYLRIQVQTITFIYWIHHHSISLVQIAFLGVLVGGEGGGGRGWSLPAYFKQCVIRDRVQFETSRVFWYCFKNDLRYSPRIVIKYTTYPINMSIPS